MPVLENTPIKIEVDSSWCHSSTHLWTATTNSGEENVNHLISFLCSIGNSIRTARLSRICSCAEVHGPMVLEDLHAIARLDVIVTDPINKGKSRKRFESTLASHLSTATWAFSRMQMSSRQFTKTSSGCSWPYNVQVDSVTYHHTVVQKHVNYHHISMSQKLASLSSPRDWWVTKLSPSLLCWAAFEGLKVQFLRQFLQNGETETHQNVKVPAPRIEAV